MQSMVCPFCGVASEDPHDSQEACIRALQHEIERTRDILTRTETPTLPRPEQHEETPERNSRAF